MKYEVYSKTWALCSNTTKSTVQDEIKLIKKSNTGKIKQAILILTKLKEKFKKEILISDFLKTLF